MYRLLFKILYRKQRLYSGIQSSILAGFLTFTFMEPLFVTNGLEISMVLLYVLSANAAAVGFSLGLLLPTVFPGICFGSAVALLAGAIFLISNSFYFPVMGGTIAIASAVYSARYVLVCVCFVRCSSIR